MTGKDKKYWGMLLHISMNMWNDKEDPNQYCPYESKLSWHKPTWRSAVDYMAECGLNMLVIDLGDAVQYESHPEIAIEGALTVEELREELDYIRAKGIVPIPKLNFSTAHDIWLGIYSRMVSTPKYYEVCRDLINEVCEIFDKPEFFHLGWDEETSGHQKTYEYAVMRGGKLWWNDLKFLCDCVRENGARPWIWSIYRKSMEEITRELPKDVMISSWFYARTASAIQEIPDPPLEEWEKIHLDNFEELESAGYEQIPCGSNWQCHVNMEQLIPWCERVISDKNLKGFLMAPWCPTIERYKYRLLDGIHLTAWAKKDYEGK